MFKKLLANKVARLTAGGLGALLAAIGGLTSLAYLQPAVEKSADYAAKAVTLYCKLPLVDRRRFRTEVNERIAGKTSGEIATVTVRCPGDVE
jgi:hypothetical protein